MDELEPSVRNHREPCGAVTTPEGDPDPDKICTAPTYICVKRLKKDPVNVGAMVELVEGNATPIICTFPVPAIALVAVEAQLHHLKNTVVELAMVIDELLPPVKLQKFKPAVVEVDHVKGIATIAEVSMFTWFILKLTVPEAVKGIRNLDREIFTVPADALDEVVEIPLLVQLKF